MLDLGFEPENSSSDITTPAGIGNVMAETLMEFRRLDGSKGAINLASCASDLSQNLIILLLS